MKNTFFQDEITPKTLNYAIPYRNQQDSLNFQSQNTKDTLGLDKNHSLEDIKDPIELLDYLDNKYKNKRDAV